jgi:hypothetical protein
MSHPIGYTSLRAQLRVRLNHREKLLGWFRMLRYLLVQGPWRPWLVRWYAARSSNPPLSTATPTLFPDVDAEAAARDLRRDAFTRSLHVPGGLTDAIGAWVAGVPAKRIDDAHVDCEPVTRIAHDPAIVAIARRYLGAEPILFTSKIYWTTPRMTAEGWLHGAAENGEYHYDLADVKAVTLFVYLSDVDTDCGPHVAIRGTQRRVTPAQILRRTVSEEFVRRHYPGRVEVITGPRGTAWFEDITCYHRQAPGTKPRLMLSIIYSLHRRPLEDLEMRPASGADSRPADRLRAAAAS